MLAVPGWPTIKKMTKLEMVENKIEECLEFIEGSHHFLLKKADNSSEKDFNWEIKGIVFLKQKIIELQFHLEGIKSYGDSFFDENDTANLINMSGVNYTTPRFYSAPYTRSPWQIPIIKTKNYKEK